MEFDNENVYSKEEVKGVSFSFFLHTENGKNRQL
jgi:hypothetical protein